MLRLFSFISYLIFSDEQNIVLRESKKKDTSFWLPGLSAVCDKNLWQALSTQGAANLLLVKSQLTMRWGETTIHCQQEPWVGFIFIFSFFFILKIFYFWLL